MNQTNRNALWNLFAASKMPEVSADALPLDTLLRLGDRDSDVRTLQRGCPSATLHTRVKSIVTADAFKYMER